MMGYEGGQQEIGCCHTGVWFSGSRFREANRSDCEVKWEDVLKAILYKQESMSWGSRTAFGQSDLQKKIDLPSVVNAARFLNYLSFLLLFSAWPGLYSSGWSSAPLLVHSCHTPSSYTESVACSDLKDSIFLRQLWKQAPALASFLLLYRLHVVGSSQ